MKILIQLVLICCLVPRPWYETLGEQRMAENWRIVNNRKDDGKPMRPSLPLFALPSFSSFSLPNFNIPYLQGFSNPNNKVPVQTIHATKTEYVEASFLLQ